ncbi:MAG TPA: cohesin domain-containing protein [Phycisphaerae bacterium]|nr:cohesin domain-containing protein [Phycisphaerae bacterium]
MTRTFCSLAIAGALLVAAPLLASPLVTLSAQSDKSSVNVGDTFTVTVSAQVANGALNDGLTAYNIDLYPTTSSQLQFLGAASQNSGISLSTGNSDPGTGGLLGVSAVFDAPGIAIGSTVPLFTVTVKALAPGATTVAAGLSVYPNGAGIPLELNVSGDYVAAPGSGNFSVDTSNAIAHVSVAVPEPSAALFVLPAVGLFLLRRRRALPAVLPLRAHGRAITP